MPDRELEIPALVNHVQIFENVMLDDQDILGQATQVTNDRSR